MGRTCFTYDMLWKIAVGMGCELTRIRRREGGVDYRYQLSTSRDGDPSVTYWEYPNLAKVEQRLQIIKQKGFLREFKESLEQDGSDY